MDVLKGAARGRIGIGVVEEIIDAVPKQQFVAEDFSSPVRIGWRATNRTPGAGTGEDAGVDTLKTSANASKRLVLYPFRVAGIALPTALADGNWKRQQQPQAVGPEAVDAFITDVEGVTARAARLGEGFAYLFLAEFRRNGLIEDGACGLQVWLAGTCKRMPPIAFDNSQSMRTRLPSASQHSMPAHSSLPFASRACGMSRKDSRVTSVVGPGASGFKFSYKHESIVRSA